jgi:monofunctional biosynthetic peptidoglycan transglycosylase
MKTIVDFAQPEAVRWTIVNDGVMGGLSTSDLEATAEGTVFFSGYVSLENNGGFASTRAAFDSMDLSEFEGVRVRVRGDGRSYQIRFRLDGSFDGISYAREFDTEPGVWQEIDLPFEGFQPTFRGYVPRGAGPLDPARIRQMGILIGDKKEGPFKLEMAWIKAYRGTTGAAPR